MISINATLVCFISLIFSFSVFSMDADKQSSKEGFYPIPEHRDAIIAAASNLKYWAKIGGYTGGYNPRFRAHERERFFVGMSVEDKLLVLSDLLYLLDPIVSRQTDHIARMIEEVRQNLMEKKLSGHSREKTNQSRIKKKIKKHVHIKKEKDTLATELDKLHSISGSYEQLIIKEPLEKLKQVIQDDSGHDLKRTSDLLCLKNLLQVVQAKVFN